MLEDSVPAIKSLQRAKQGSRLVQDKKGRMEVKRFFGLGAPRFPRGLALH